MSYSSGHALVQPFAIIHRHWALMMEMARREISDRYAGQILGMLWAVGHPLIVVFVYVFIFGHVFAVKVGGTVAMPLDYTTYLLSALLPWMAFQEAMGKGTTVIIANSGLVKQVVFPTEILPVKGVVVCLVTQFVGTICLIAHVSIAQGKLPWTYTLLPLLWLFQTLGMIGVSLILAAVGTFFRDVKDFVQVFCVVGIYTMPICYLPEWVPELVQPLLYLNPFSYMTWCFQDAAYYGRIDHPWAWPVFMGGSVFVFYVGFRLFTKFKVFFGNVL